jgi:hypothetical protein
MVKPIMGYWVIFVAVMMGFILMTGSAQAKHHKKKHPKPTPTTSTRLHNPRDVQD